jgi:hypothetical protein
LKSGLHTCKKALYHLSYTFNPFCSGGRWGLANYLPKLSLNCDPSNCSLPSSWDYRREPLAPGLTYWILQNGNIELLNSEHALFFETKVNSPGGDVVIVRVIISLKGASHHCAFKRPDNLP